MPQAIAVIEKNNMDTTSRKDGVVVDGNRRLATLRELYEQKPSDYKFKQI